MRNFLATFIVALCTAATVQAASLSNLASGATLSVGDLVFDNFVFVDDNPAPLSGDFVPDTSKIELTTSTIGSVVSLDFAIHPNDTPPGAVMQGGSLFFDFTINFDVSVTAPSSAVINQIRLDGDPTATLDAFVEVDVADRISVPNFNIEIFDSIDPLGSVTDQQLTDATSTGLGLTSTPVTTRVFAETFAPDATVGLTLFSLDFDLLNSTPPPPPVVPLPGAFSIMLSGLVLGGFIARRRR